MQGHGLEGSIRGEGTKISHATRHNQKSQFANKQNPSATKSCGVCARVLSRFSGVWLIMTLRTAAHQAPMGFSRQEYRSGLPCPSLGDFPDPGIKIESLMSPALAGGFFTISATWEAHQVVLFPATCMQKAIHGSTVCNCKIWKPQTCPYIGAWPKELCNVRTREHFTAIRKEEDEL